MFKVVIKVVIVMACALGNIERREYIAFIMEMWFIGEIAVALH
jgi:hypothetical protein